MKKHKQLTERQESPLETNLFSSKIEDETSINQNEDEHSEAPLRYFELGLGNSVEEDWETFDATMGIRCTREPKSIQEANEFIKRDLLNRGY